MTSDPKAPQSGSPPGDRRDGPQLAVLAYHKVGAPSPGGWETWFYVPERTFADHLRRLKANGWHVIDLATFLGGLAQPDRLGPRSVLITFDDGYRSVLEGAAPLLGRFEYPAVMFVPTAFVGGRNTFDDGVEPEEPICDWDELRELARRGFAIESHGVSHRSFSALDAREQGDELRRSKAILEDHLRTAVRAFSYPYGDAGTDPAGVEGRLRQAGYEAGFLYGDSRLAPARPYRLARVAMGPDTDLEGLLGERRLVP